MARASLGPSKLRSRSPTAHRPAASHAPRPRPGRPCAPRCGPGGGSGAGDLLKLRTEGSAAAETGHPRGAGVVQLGLCRAHVRRVDMTLNLAWLSRELGQQCGPYLRPVRVLNGLQGDVYGCRQHPPASGLVTGARRADLAAQARHRRRVDRRIPERQGAGDVAQLAPPQRRGEQNKEMAAAARRDVGEDVAAAAGHERGEGLGLNADLVRRDSTMFMVVLDSTIVNITAAAARVKVKSQHPPGSSARVIHRHGARLPRSVGGERAGMAGRVSPAAVTRNPDMRSTCNTGRYRTPSRRSGARCPGVRRRARTWRNYFRILRRVVRGQ